MAFHAAQKPYASLKKLEDLTFYEGLRREFELIPDSTVFITKSLLLGIIDKTVEVLKEKKRAGRGALS